MKKNEKGFTLLEVLIALAVLSIGMLGIYSLQSMSFNTLVASKEKMFVIERGYDRISRQINFPNKAYEETEDYDGKIVTYKFEKTDSGVFGVQKVTLIVTTDSATASFVYYEKASGSGGFGI